MKNGRLSVIRKTYLLLLLILGITMPSIAQGQVIDKIVGQIGNEIILLSDIQAQRLSMIQNGMEGNQATDCEILEEFLFEKLLVNQAKIDSVDIPAELVNQEMERRIQHIASQIGSIQALEEFYGKPVAKIKAEFFEMIKKRMLAEKMQDIITENVTITPKEVEKFYTSLPADSVPDINAKLKIAQIVYYPQISEADKEVTRAKLNDIRDEVNRGDLRFESAASIYSDDPGSRADGGNLGWQTRGNMVPEFEAALFNLKTPLEISEVFETQYGYHIVQLLERKGDNYKSRHILLMNKVNKAALTAASKSIDSLYNEIRLGNISFAEAARRFSNDEDSKYNGGQIVNPYSGDYLWDINNLNEIDPQMSQIVQSMTIGEMSSPSLYINYMEQNKQGIRFVKLIDRSEPHVANLKTDRQLIEMAAMAKKRQKVIDAWIESKINGSFVLIDEKYQSACEFKYHWIKPEKEKS